MSAQLSLREQRLAKLSELRDAGYQPYANDFRPELTCAEVREKHDADSAEVLEKSERVYTVAGRVTAMRRMGKATFFNVQDRTGYIQIFARKDQVGEDVYKHLKTFDLGDIVGVAGKPFRTKTDELTLAAHGLRILTKSLRPLPEKWHGLTDVETRYRQRYVDLIANPEVRSIFKSRARIVSEIRRFLDARDFLEVETPILQGMAGGAAAAPFVTHHNALDRNLFLRIATELHLKRLVVGGLERVYEIGRCFRNEGLSRRHNPEFTSLEMYQAYATADDLIEFTQELIAKLALNVTGKPVVTYQGSELNFAPPFERITMADAVARHLGVAPLSNIASVVEASRVVRGHTPEGGILDVILSDLEDSEITELLPACADGGTAEMLKTAHMQISKAQEPVAALEDFTGRVDGLLDPVRRRAIALHVLYACFEHEVEETLVQPTFVTDYPLPASPLSRQRDNDPAVVDRFELFVAGLELANAFSELSDPVEQRARFERQLRLRSRGDDEAHGMDEDFVRALEIGMPPTAGEGIGIDRLTMILTDSASIREVILFPQLRSDEEPVADGDNEQNDGDQE